MNRYRTSNGQSITQATIDQRRSRAYREIYEGEPHPCCFECGKPAQGSMHIVPQSICKQLGKAEFCYDAINICPACHLCNQAVENITSPQFKQLNGYITYLEVTKIISIERYNTILQ